MNFLLSRYNENRSLLMIVAAVVVTGSAILHPSPSRAKKFAGEFMSQGGGARALGMGGAFAAVAGDASTVFWNPAGISGFDSREALFMHSERFGNLLDYNFASYVMPVELFGTEKSEEALGFALIHLGASDIVVTSGLRYEERNGVEGFQPEEGDRLIYDAAALPRESNNDFAFLGSYAFRSRFGRLGGTLKIIYTDAVAGYSSFGFGLDFGFLKRDLFPNFDLGVKIQDVSGTYISWSSGTNEFIVPSLKLGTSYRYHSDAMKGTFLVALDGDFFFENRRAASQFWIGEMSADMHLGAEVAFQDKVMVRGGLDAGNPTAGAGIRLGFLGFDYAYLHHDDFEATHRVSALARF